MDAEDFNRAYRGERRRRRLQRVVTLRPELLNYRPDDFIKSAVPCDCLGTAYQSKHFKLQSENLTICPILLSVGWARLWLNGFVVPDFDVAVLLERAR